MRARMSRRGAVLILVLTLALAAVATVGCGKSDEPSTTSPATTAAADGRSADQIVNDSEAKMATVDSARFTSSFGLKLEGDTGNMTDPTAKALLSQGVAVRTTGKSSSKPAAADTAMSVDIAGQTLEFDVRAAGKEAWVQYQGSWYEVDSKDTEALDRQAEAGAAPTGQLKSLGIDPSTWSTEYALVGVETLEGTQVYHVRGRADAQKVAGSLTGVLRDPEGLGKKSGDSDGDLGQLFQSLTQDTKQIRELADGIVDATVDYWIGVDDAYLYKQRFAATVDTSGQKDLQGVSGMSVSGAVTMSDFGQAFEVAAPTGAKPFDELTGRLFGGLLGGSSGGLTF